MTEARSATRRSDRVRRRSRGALLGLSLASCLAACATPVAFDPSLAQLRIVGLPVLDAAQVELPPLTLLVEVAPAIDDAALASADERAQYARHACRTAESFLRRVSRDAPVRVQRFRTRNSDAEPCTIDPGRRASTTLAPDIWEVDALTTAFVRWAEDPDRADRRIQLVADLAPANITELCRVAAPWTAQGIWVESIRLDGGPPLRQCLGDAPAAPARHVIALLEAATPPARPYRIMRPAGDGALSTLFRGTTSDDTLQLTPGPVTVVLEGETEEELGPFLLRPGTLTTLRTVPVRAAGGTESAPPSKAPMARHWWEIEQTRAAP